MPLGVLDNLMLRLRTSVGFLEYLAFIKAKIAKRVVICCNGDFYFIFMLK